MAKRAKKETLEQAQGGAKITCKTRSLVVTDARAKDWAAVPTNVRGAFHCTDTKVNWDIVKGLANIKTGAENPSITWDPQGNPSTVMCAF